MPQWGYGSTLNKVNCRQSCSPTKEAIPRKLGPESQAAGHRHQPLLQTARIPASAPMRLVMTISPPGLTTRTNSSKALSGCGTAVTTYCATTTSKDESGKSRLSASMTASPSTWVKCNLATRSRALHNISAEISTPNIEVSEA